MITFTNKQLPITLHYPDPTPLGYPVKVIEKRSEVSYRVHLISDGSYEIYFEIGKYLTLSTTEAINRFQTGLIESANNVEIDPIETSIFLSRPAYFLKARWTDKERQVVFVEYEETVCRIIYDPASDINKQILRTLAFK